MKQYTPRRAPARFLKNAPPHVLDLFKTPSGSYEVLYGGSCLLSNDTPGTFASTCIMGREMDRDPTHPQGLGVSFELSAWEARGYRSRNRHRRVRWEDLPEKVQCVAIRDGQA